MRYREGFFEQLRARLAEDGIRLRLIESGPDDPAAQKDRLELPWAERAPAHLLRIFGHEAIVQRVWSAARGSDLIVVEQGSRLLVNYLFLLEQRLGRGKVAFWGHGRDFQQPDGSPSERVKAFVSRRVHWWFAYNALSASVVADLGFPPARITDVRNATDTGALRTAVDAVTAADRDAVRAELGLGAGPVALFVGRLVPLKRLDYLFQAADEVHRARPDLQLVVAGGGPEHAWVEREVAARPWARLTGPRFGADLARLMSVADVLLVPTWVGLVVVDSFAAGLPLVARASAAHPPEVSYLESGVNGLLVDDDGDPARYAAAVVELLGDAPRLAQLRAGARAAAADLSASAMAERFAAGVRAALAT